MGRGAGGGGPFTTGSSLMGGLTYNDVMGASREAKDAKLYPVRLRRLPIVLRGSRTKALAD